MWFASLLDIVTCWVVVWHAFRLIRLSDAFSAYTTDGLSGDESIAVLQRVPAAAVTPSRPAPAAAAPGSFAPVPAFAMTAMPATASSSSTLSPAAKDALLAVFSRKGSYVQELLVDELVAAVDALSREALSETLRLVLGSAPVALAMSSIEAAGPLRPLLLPFTGPLEILSRLAPAVALTPEDEEALGVVRGIFLLVQRLQGNAAVSSSSGTYSNPAAGMVFSTTGGSGSRPSVASMLRPAVLDGRSAAAAAAEAFSGATAVAEELRPLLPELLPGLQHTGQLFVRTFVRRVMQRAAESLQLPGGMTAEQREEAIAMAALNFMPRAAPGASGFSSGASGFGNATAGFTSSAWSSSSANQFGRTQLHGQQQQQQFGGAGMSAFSSAAGWGARGGSGWQPTTMGQLVTGLAAAPILAVLTPLAILSEMQRRQQQQAGEQQDNQQL